MSESDLKYHFNESPSINFVDGEWKTFLARLDQKLDELSPPLKVKFLNWWLRLWEIRYARFQVRCATDDCTEEPMDATAYVECLTEIGSRLAKAVDEAKDTK